MTELQAGLANVGLERFPEQARQREEMAAYMDEALREVAGIRLLKRDPRHTTRSFYRYVFALTPQVFGAEHDLVCAALAAEGIPCWTKVPEIERQILAAEQEFAQLEYQETKLKNSVDAEIV